jgi:hypothetical protein
VQAGPHDLSDRREAVAGQIDRSQSSSSAAVAQESRGRSPHFSEFTAAPPPQQPVMDAEASS